MVPVFTLSKAGDTMQGRATAVGLLGTLVAGAWGCDHASTGPTTGQPAALVSVSPQGGATGVDPHSRIMVTFSHAMRSGMEMYASLHEGDVTGSDVPCTAVWSMGRDTLMLTPSAPLKGGTTYTLHLGGGMKDANGNTVDMSDFGSHMGGQWATSAMMSGSGMMGGGGPMSGQEMGTGWAGPNGMYGMVFSFITS